MKTHLVLAIFLIIVGPSFAATPDSSEPWAPRPALMPKTIQADGTWAIHASGGPSDHGGWDLHWKAIEPGQWYRAEISCNPTGVPHLQDNAHVELIWWRANGKRANWSHVFFEKKGDRTLRFAHTAQAPADAVRATLRLMLRWTDRGTLNWSAPSLTPTDPPAPRKLVAAIATGRFPGGSVEANLDFAIDLVRQSASRGAQVVCLPEVITTWRIKEDDKARDDGARPIPGPETDALCEAAAKHDIDIVCSINEREGDLIYNTGIYIDAERGLIGKYRKVHLSVGERWRGVTPGTEFPVWDTGYGKAGMLICYDNVHAEGHRILSNKGAEVLFLPIMGDPRAIGDEAYENWLRIMQVRAIDNHIWFVISQNKGDRGIIIRPDGTIAAKVNPENGIAIAELDLNMRFDSTIGSDFENRNRAERRPHLYKELTEDR